jgi:S-adenosylmethionine synthetase
VYQTAQYINYELVDEFPVGEDVKVMGLRRNGELTLTVALPFIATRIGDATEYQEVKQAAKAAIQEYAAQLDHRKVTVMVNTADDVARGAVYLTLTGTSAEMGDDGAVGRGNRVNGVIAPFRSTSLEAACGKNPISHVGKVYNVLALTAAQEIVEQVEVEEASVYILSQIGAPLEEPLIATALVRATNGTLTPAVRADVESILDRKLATVHDLRESIMCRALTLF